MMDYPASYYAATAIDAAAAHAPLTGAAAADVCVVGAGFAGLTTSLELARLGVDVCLVEAERAGWGASGRNGGFVSPGFAQSLPQIIARCGLEHARELFQLSREGAGYVRRAIEAHQMQDVRPVAGYLHVQRHPDPQEFLKYRDLLAAEFDYPIEVLGRGALSELLHSGRYHCAWSEHREGFHMHPLNYALGLAGAVQEAGGRIYEHSPALGLSRRDGIWTITTADGVVRAKHVVLCGSAYMHKKVARLASCLLPVSTYVAVTEPLGPRLHEAIRTRAGILDTRRASDYYRIIGDDRLMWGGRITTRLSKPADLAAKMQRDIQQVFPQLGGFRMEYAWRGLMGYAPHKMPLIGQIEPGLWAATAFGGHGLNTTAMAGQLIAGAIGEGDDRYRLFAPYKIRWAGGLAGRLGVQLSYWFMQWRDRMAER